MTTSPETAVAPPRPRVSSDTAATRRPTASVESPCAGLTTDERAELLTLRAEKLALQSRINELNVQLILVKAAAALFVGERGRPGHGSIAAPEVA
jgi:hypothetical protein